MSDPDAALNAWIHATQANAYDGSEEVAMEAEKQKAIDDFDEHLGICHQCETQPFNLCKAGHALLILAAKAGSPLIGLLGEQVALTGEGR